MAGARARGMMRDARFEAACASHSASAAPLDSFGPYLTVMTCSALAAPFSRSGPRPLLITSGATYLRFNCLTLASSFCSPFTPCALSHAKKRRRGSGSRKASCTALGSGCPSVCLMPLTADAPGVVESCAESPRDFSGGADLEGSEAGVSCAAPAADDTFAAAAAVSLARGAAALRGLRSRRDADGGAAVSSVKQSEDGTSEGRCRCLGFCLLLHLLLPRRLAVRGGSAAGAGEDVK